MPPDEVLVVCEGTKGHSRNIGAARSKTDIVAYLDSDCIAPPDWVKAIEENVGYRKPAFAAAGGPYVPLQKTSYALSSYRNMGSATGWFSSQFRRKEDERRTVKSVPGGNCAFWRTTLAAVGGYDERPFISEDVDICSKIRAAGFTITFVPEMWVYHRWKAWDGLTSLAQTAYAWGKSRARTAT